MICQELLTRPDGTKIPDPPLPMLITGITGVPGYNALDYFQKLYPGQVFGIRQIENEKFEGTDIIVCNAEDPEGLAEVFDRYRFRSVLDCAGSCALKPCEVSPKSAWKNNVEVVRNILRQSVPHGARLVHLSIDLVFSGDKGGDYLEDDPTDPITMYGKTMVAGEEAVLEEDPGAAILRISLPMGISFNGHAGAIDWIESRFSKLRPATLYFDEVRTPTYTECMNRVYHEMLVGDYSGIYHAGGPRKLTLYQIAQIINRTGDYDPDHLFGIPRNHAGPIPPRAGDVTMDSSKLTRALGYQPFAPWPLDDDLVPTDRRWHYDRPEHESRSPNYLIDRLVTNPLFRNPGSQKS